MSITKQTDVYADIGNQLATGNNIPVAEPIACNATQELEKEIARLTNNNKLLQSKLTERDHETLTLNQFLTKYNFHEIFTSDNNVTAIVRSMSSEHSQKHCGKFGRIIEVTYNPDESVTKETKIKYLEYSIVFDISTNNYIGNINDLTHLYYDLIGGYCNSIGQGSFPALHVGESIRLIKILSHLSRKGLLPEGLKPIDKICVCSVKTITNIDGNKCEQCNTNYVDHMFETSGWNKMYSDEDKKYFYDKLKQHKMD
jgi:hypothetical protein